MTRARAGRLLWHDLLQGRPGARGAGGVVLDVAGGALVGARKIRGDLVGVVYVRSDLGEPVALAAGQDVPDGAAVGEHLLDEADADAAESGPQAPPRSGKGSGVAEWLAYAEEVGVAVPEGASREDVIAAVDAAAGGQG